MVWLRGYDARAGEGRRIHGLEAAAGVPAAAPKSIVPIVAVSPGHSTSVADTV